MAEGGTTSANIAAHKANPDQQDREFAQLGRDLDSVRALNTTSLESTSQAHQATPENQDWAASNAGKADIRTESIQFVEDQQAAAALTEQIRAAGAQKVAEARAHVTHSTTYVGLGTESSPLDPAQTARLDAQGKSPTESGGNFFSNLLKTIIRRKAA